MAYCSHCGSELGRGATICGSCGTKRAGVAWELASEICDECGEPTARGWRFCVTCGTPTTVVGRGRSVKVEASQVRSWFVDLLPVESDPSSGEPDPVSSEADPVQGSARGPADEVPSRQPAAASTGRTRRRGPYSSPALAAGTAQRALLSMAIMAGIAAAVLLVLNSRLTAFKAGSPESFDAAVQLAGLADWGTRPLALLAVLAATWYLMRWTGVAYGNIFSFGKTSLRLPPSAVPWAFFVPGLNLVAPPRLINDAWRAADPASPGGQDWMLQHGNGWTRVTWSSVVASVACHAVGWSVGSATVDAAIAANRWASAGWAAIAVAGTAAVFMVQRVTERQEQHHADLAATVAA